MSSLSGTTRRDLIVATTCGLAVVGLWVAWLGWRAETTYVNGNGSGPYTADQVIGLVLSLVAVIVVASLLAHWPQVLAGMLVGMVLVASADWGGHQDQDGMWLIGVMMLGTVAAVVGAGLGLGATAAKNALGR